MSILSDLEILELGLRMINPFFRQQQKAGGKISYGLSSYGYDIRLGATAKIFTNIHSTVVDPKNFNHRSFVDTANDDSFCSDHFIIPPNSFMLGSSVEHLTIPRDILVVCLGKSTYARCGLIVNVTPLEPEWSGFITLEISNTTPLPAKVYINEGIAQLLFFRAHQTCNISYADRAGKYQNQIGVTLPR